MPLSLVDAIAAATATSAGACNPMFATCPQAHSLQAHKAVLGYEDCSDGRISYSITDV